MAITKCTVDVDNISSLSSTPNSTEGLTAAQLQAKFDKTGSDLKTYINDTLTTEMDAEVAALKEGWVSGGTMTYASAVTITVASGAAAIYNKGDKLRFKQGAGYKYFNIIAVADTLLTVTGGTDYTVANTTITDVYYSHALNPIGFPKYFNYTPTVSADSGTITTSSASIKFNVTNDKVFVYGTTTVTDKGTAAGVLKNTLPVTAAAVSAGAGRENVTTGNMIEVYADTANVKFWKYDNTDALNNNWTITYSVNYIY